MRVLSNRLFHINTKEIVLLIIYSDFRDICSRKDKNAITESMNGTNRKFNYGEEY